MAFLLFATLVPCDGPDECFRKLLLCFFLIKALPLLVRCSALGYRNGLPEFFCLPHIAFPKGLRFILFFLVPSHFEKKGKAKGDLYEKPCGGDKLLRFPTWIVS